ncbi:MAG TPA: hypothetical protein VHY83_11810 [Solirubrobacteraceae bacterium]|nr:hypothetical protein [Solirubrobacteraceae bacterium]
MPVPQLVIDLLNVPVPTLRKVAARHGVGEGISTLRKWDLAQAVSRIPRGELEAEIGEYLYAGSTSLSWVRLAPAGEEINDEDPDAFSGLRGVELSGTDVLRALGEHGDADPFSETARPEEIDETPKLVVAREQDDGYMLTFAVAKRIGHVIHNFEHTPVFEDEFFNALLRPGLGSVEVRGSASRARRLERTWLAVFADSLDAQPRPVAITQEDFHALHDQLKGRLDVYRGKTTTGVTVFDTHEFTKADSVDDLLPEPEFERQTRDLEPVSFDLLFDAAGFGDVRIHVSVRNGSIFVRTAVPDRVLRYIYEVLERIKSR